MFGVAASLILGAVFGMFVSKVIKKFWNPIHEWVKKMIGKVQQKINRAVLGIFLIIKRTADGLYKQVSRHITKNNGIYEQTDVVTNRPIPAEDVPEDIRMANNCERDVSEKYEEVLKNTA
ncbi:MAG: hypothetical protein HDT21_05900 [Ruminococcus sp.]|nr:hypothetical protein [Ruminococcus sp.]